MEENKGNDPEASTSRKRQRNEDENDAEPSKAPRPPTPPPPPKSKRIKLPLEKPKPSIPVIKSLTETPTPENPHCLVMLPNELIQHIMSHLNHTDIFNVAQTCHRLGGVVADPNLWLRVDTRGSNPMTVRETKKFMKFCHADTKSVILHGPLARNIKNLTHETVTPHLLKLLDETCPDLDEFGLEEANIDASKLEICHFPRKVSKFSLRSSELKNSTSRDSWFKLMHKCMPNLKKLDLRWCSWISNHSLMAICKNENLEWLSMQGVHQMGECFAYTALACRFGFRNLKHFDLRDTKIGNSEVAAFAHLPKLENLYLGTTQPELNANAALFQLYESRGDITDRGVLSMCVHRNPEGEAPPLKHLCLANTDVTDQYMNKLATAFGNLQTLDVRGTGVTAESVNSIRNIRPKCQVLIDPDPKKIKKFDANEAEDDHVVIFAPEIAAAPAPPGLLAQIQLAGGGANGEPANPIIIVNPAHPDQIFVDHGPPHAEEGEGEQQQGDNDQEDN